MMANQQKKKRSKLGIIIQILIIMLLLLIMGCMGNKSYVYLLVTGIIIGFLGSSRHFKLYGWKHCLSFMLALGVSLITIIYFRPNRAVSISGSLVSGGLKFAFTHLIDAKETLFIKRQQEEEWIVTEGYENEVIPLTNCQLELLKKDGSERVIYQIHGGAFINALTNSYRDMAVYYSEISRYADVASINYRTESEAAYPAAMQDTMEGYQYLLGAGYLPKNIIIVGDSAGANLAITLLFSLRREGEGMPAGIILMSPWADIAENGDSYIINAYVDPLFSQKDNAKSEQSPIPKDYFTGLDLEDPYVSPVYGDYSGFPPMLIQTGTYEILLSDSQTIYEKCHEVGVEVTFTKYEGMFHVFQVICGRGIPEAKDAWKEVENFISKIYQYSEGG